MSWSALASVASDLSCLTSCPDLCEDPESRTPNSRLQCSDDSCCVEYRIYRWIFVLDLPGSLRPFPAPEASWPAWRPGSPSEGPGAAGPGRPTFFYKLPRSPHEPLFGALWFLFDAIWDVLKGSWGVLVFTNLFINLDPKSM